MHNPDTMPDDTEVPFKHKKTSHSEIPLYVHIRLQTHKCQPYLAPDDVMQLAQTSIAARLRALRCQTVAIGGTADHLHAVIRFSFSLPVSEVVKAACASSSESIVKLLKYVHSRNLSAYAVWERFYGMRTLSSDDVPEVAAYVQNQEMHHRLETTREELEIMITPSHISQPETKGYLIREITPPYATDEDDLTEADDRRE